MGHSYERVPIGDHESYYVCRNCKVLLANFANIISKNFHGSTGPAVLISNVVNVRHRKVEIKMLMTGRHYTSTIECSHCSFVIGWFYDYACDPSQMYKEGKYIIEVGLVLQEDHPKLVKHGLLGFF
ncbi:protein yippee-like [Sycon ciliatum]|uniref:protein yippee-like n=1 Tax=Sycon ciliatum TaxID=27933 RepID=UPI0020ACD85B|eukprot:scpid95372/ scgid34420/ Protein yippee-like 5 &gt; Protein yippee-like 5 &gt; Protein yippee-like 5 &gt; Protein yippee-like 5 &gt; Protein yippee-like 5